MEISPAVPAPRAGDPITAKWAADLAAAVNSCANPSDRVGEVSTPFGKASPAPGLPMLGTATMPQPFDVALYRAPGASADKLYIWLPDLSADYVLYAGQPIPAAPGQTIGGSSTAWVEIGTVANGAAHYIYLVPHLDTNDEVDGWEITDAAAAWDPSGGGTGDELPHVLLAYYNIAADSPVPSPGDDNYFPSGQNGLVQCRHGTIEFGAGDVQTDCDVTPGAGEYAPGQSVDTWEGQSGTPVTPPPLELRAFWNTADVEATQGIGETGSATEPDALQVLFRKKAPGSSPSQRPKLVYAEAEDGPFWVKGADATQNWGESIKLGTPALGFITISVTQ
jgi:hypothetical protein